MCPLTWGLPSGFFLKKIVRLLYWHIQHLQNFLLCNSIACCKKLPPVQKKFFLNSPAWPDPNLLCIVPSFEEAWHMAWAFRSTNSRPLVCIELVLWFCLHCFDIVFFSILLLFLPGILWYRTICRMFMEKKLIFWEPLLKSQERGHLEPHQHAHPSQVRKQMVCPKTWVAYISRQIQVSYICFKNAMTRMQFCLTTSALVCHLSIS